MRTFSPRFAAFTVAILALLLAAVHAQTNVQMPAATINIEAAKPDASAESEEFKPEQQASKGSVTVGGNVINYDAFAGTLVVHPKDWDDVPQNTDKDDKNQPPEASMFYVAYFKSDSKGAARPVTFLYNGGPGSSTVWLHMGAFGPKRVVTADDSHTPAAPYPVVNNDYSLLDVSDLVFVDAPGTGFSRISGKDREKAFYGVDQDAHAFADFIVQFLAKYGRWNSPKYLFGESYGTTRSAVLVERARDGTRRGFQRRDSAVADIELRFQRRRSAVQSRRRTALPARPAHLCGLGLVSPQAAGCASGIGAVAGGGRALCDDRLRAGARGGVRACPGAARRRSPQSCTQYTGLPVEYIEKADLRINGGEFEKTLQDEAT